MEYCINKYAEDRFICVTILRSKYSFYILGETNIGTKMINIPLKSKFFTYLS